jgi:hypothetical protein
MEINVSMYESKLLVITHFTMVAVLDAFTFVLGALFPA